MGQRVMSDGFTEMVGAARAFFSQLASNNSKAFFEAHRDLYMTEIRKPTELLADLVAEDLARMTGKPHGPKVFRIHRDIRFSKDKTPYKTYQHVLWSRPGGVVAPAWFFGMDAAGVVVGMGLIGFEKESLATYRQMVDRDGDDLTDAMDQATAGVGAVVSDWGPEPLKRVPKPYDPDHPHADLLRRKAFALRAGLPDGWDERGLIPALLTVAEGLLPVWSVLNRHFPG